jgi:putative flavoprotein involved in K+ transport
VADLLRHTMDSTDATTFQVAEGEEPDEADGVVTAYFTFETAVGRGSGMLRLNDEGAWTFLTTLDELKGFEENQGTTRPKAVQARRPQGAGHVEGGPHRRCRGPRQGP